MASSRSTSACTPIPKADHLVAPPDSMVGYPGSKAASGLCERIIRQMPPHNVYIEAFAGCAAVFRKKAPAASSVLMDVDSKLCHRLRSYLAGCAEVGRVEVIHGDAMEILPSLPAVKAPGTLVYFDPPYLRETRSKMVLYDFEFTTPDAHSALLTMAAALPCMVMISGYMSKLYARTLKRWWMIEIPAMTRGGPRTECLWSNFPEPKTLHDARFAGGDFRERERIKRKRERWQAKFLGMDPRERQAIAAALVGVDRASVEAAMRSATPAAAMVDPASTIVANDATDSGR